MKRPQNTTSNERKVTVGQVMGWAQELTLLHARIAARFARAEPRRRALSYLRGLLSDTARKNGWQLAEHAREATPYGMQRLLSSAVWSADLVRDDVRAYVIEHLGSDQGILVVDESGFPKAGEKSAGVQQQYCGCTGQVENCQVGVFLAYVSAWGQALIDRELYLPQSWTQDRQRCQEAGIPKPQEFQTKCELARQMIERAWHAQLPVKWVVADTVYGDNEVLRDWLQARGYWYVLAVDCQEPVNLPTDTGRKRMQVGQVETQVLRPQDWQRLSMGEGTKGPRLFDWACVPILHRGVADGCHWLLIRRPVDGKKTTYYFVFAPPATQLSEMIQILGARWRIEELFQAAKALGLDEYEVRSWIGWLRHMTLVMLAHAYLSVICAREKAATLASARTNESDRLADSPAASSETTARRDAATSQAVGSPVVDHTLTPPERVKAALTVPEVRHLLARLIWPLSSGSPFVLAWSDWRREHRSRARHCHTQRRLKAG